MRLPFSISLPPLSYGIERDIPWPRWFHITSYVVFFLAVVVLIPVNYALQGYQTVSSYQQDFNITTNYWYNKLVGKQEPGSQCQPAFWNLGDNFLSSVGVFQWTLVAIWGSTGNITTVGQETGMPYSGTTLDWCDVQLIQVTADFAKSKAVASAAVACINSDFQVTFTTSIHSGFPDEESFNELQVGGATAGPKKLTQNAGLDLIAQGRALISSSTSSPTMLSIIGDTTMCPKILIGDTDRNQNNNGYLGRTFDCSLDSTFNPPNMGLNFSTVVTDNPSTAVYTAAIQNAVNNFMQVMHAAIRIDLNNILPNNLFTNTTQVIPAGKTILPPFTAPAGEAYLAPSGTFYPQIQGSDLLFDSFNIPNKSAQIVTPYLCQLTVPKDAGSAFISVLVAVLSMSQAGWGGGLLVITYLALRNKGDAVNYCEYHALEAKRGVITSPRAEKATPEEYESLAPQLRHDPFSPAQDDGTSYSRQNSA